MTIKEALNICSAPCQYSVQQLKAASIFLAANYSTADTNNAGAVAEEQRAVEADIKKLKQDAAEAYLAIYTGSEIKDIKPLQKLLKYLDSTAQVYNIINKQLKKNVPEIGLIAKYVKRDKEIVEDIIDRIRKEEN